MAVHAAQSPDPSTGALMVSIYVTSTCAQASPGEPQGLEYSRSQNPTPFTHQRCIAALECGVRGFAITSGKAATSTELELRGPDKARHAIVPPVWAQ